MLRVRDKNDDLYEVACRKHPSYKAKRHPRGRCDACWGLWKLAEAQEILSRRVEVVKWHADAEEPKLRAIKIDSIFEAVGKAEVARRLEECESLPPYRGDWRQELAELAEEAEGR